MSKGHNELGDWAVEVDLETIHNAGGNGLENGPSGSVENPLKKYPIIGGETPRFT